MITWSRGDGLPDCLWAGNTASDEERSAAALTGGLANLGFFTAVLRRKARVWCLTAVIGLVIGTGLYVKFPPAYHATTTVLLVYNGSREPLGASGERAEHGGKSTGGGTCRVKLKLPQSAASFQAAYSVTVVTGNVLTIVQRRRAVQHRSGAASSGRGHGLSPVPCPVRAEPGAATVRSAPATVQRGSATPPGA